MFFRYLLLGFLFASGFGPVNIETAKKSLKGETLEAIVFAFGNIFADALYIFLIMLGFSFFAENLVFKLVIGIFGSIFLLYLGISNIIDSFKKDLFLINKELAKKSLVRLFAEGVFLNLANPLTIASWIAFYGVASSDFTKSAWNFVAVIIGSIILSLSIVVVGSILKRLMSNKVMKIISFLAGSALIVFSGIFVYNLMGLI